MSEFVDIDPNATLDVKLSASPQLLESLVARSAVESGLRADPMVDRDLGPCFVLRSGSGNVGKVFVWSHPQGSLLHVPSGRGATHPQVSWKGDPSGQFFREWLTSAFALFQKLDLLPRRTILKSGKMLETARTQLAAAEDAVGFAAIGNVCRSAMIALANELFKEEMTPTDATAPKHDDADTKLIYVSKHYGAGHSERQSAGVTKVVEGTWNIATAVSHRKSATREDAELCVLMTSNIFDSFALLSAT